MLLEPVKLVMHIEQKFFPLKSKKQIIVLEKYREVIDATDLRYFSLNTCLQGSINYISSQSARRDNKIG